MATTSLIIGLGKTGQSCLHFLHDQQHKLIVYDTREQVPMWPELSQQWPQVDFYHGQNLPNLQGVDQLVVSPGVSSLHPLIVEAQARQIPVLGDVALFAQAARAPILAITGTNGKTTATYLAAHLLQGCGKQVVMAGNVGTPVLDVLSKPVPDYYVLELSSFQLALTLQLGALGAVILNITSDHLDRHGDMASYRAAKMQIFKGAKWCVGPEAIPPLPGWAKGALSAHLTTEHNQHNTAAVLALLEPLRLSRHELSRALLSFQGLPHRCEEVDTDDGLLWVNDSKATNEGAAIAAIQHYASHQPLVLLAGGQAKGQDFRQLASVCQDQVSQVVLFGESAAAMSGILSGQNVVSVANLSEAVAWVKQHIKPPATILLSPACASLDQFQSYAERGKQFKQLLKATSASFQSHL